MNIRHLLKPEVEKKLPDDAEVITNGEGVIQVCMPSGTVIPLLDVLHIVDSRKG